MKRIEVLKTFKLYIDGQFPRTESGRYYSLKNKKNESIANVCLSSRKDFRNGAVASRNAFESWSQRSAFNRSQILYRIGEVLEARKSQFIKELMLQGSTKKNAEEEILIAIDRCIYYAGWCDKFQQINSSVNPVSTAHFNFSVPEAMGVVCIVAPETTSLIGLVSVILPCIAGGNTCVILASESKPLCAISFAEVLVTSDVPKGVVNILTGTSTELTSQFASHMDVNALVYCRKDLNEWRQIKELAANNVKRTYQWLSLGLAHDHQNPYLIMDLQEIKTTWHPIEKIASSGGKY